MKRRDTIAALLALGASCLPTGALAQQKHGKVFRIGFLGAAKPTPEILKVTLDPFRQGMREHGWIEGQNYVIEQRWAEGRPERHAEDAAGLVRLGVDVFLMVQPAAIRAAMQATQTIPIVMVAPADPVRDGFIASYAHPGGNVTGLSYGAGVTVFVKQLDIIRQIVPKISRVALFTNPAAQIGAHPDLRGAISSIGLRLVEAGARTADEIEPAFIRMKDEGAQAVLVLADGLIVANTARIAELALKYRLPLSSQWQGFPRAGGLMFYGPDLADNYRRSAAYVDKIFRGAKPADLPVERPTRFRLIINLKTAKILGLKVPQAVLLIADELVE